MSQLLRLLTLSIFLFCGCSQDDMIEKFSSPEDRLAAARLLSHLRAGDFAIIEKAIDPSLEGPTLRAKLEEMRGLIPDREPAAVKLVGSQTFHAPGATTVNTTFEYDYGDKWLLANVAIKKTGASRTIVGITVTPTSQSVASAHRFTLSGKEAIHYVVLVSSTPRSCTAQLLRTFCLHPGEASWQEVAVDLVYSVWLRAVHGQLDHRRMELRSFVASAAQRLGFRADLQRVDDLRFAADRSDAFPGSKQSVDRWDVVRLPSSERSELAWFDLVMTEPRRCPPILVAPRRGSFE